MSKKKSINEIDNRDKSDENSDSSKIIPKEVKNLHYVLRNYPHINKYSWEVDGERV